MSRSVGSHCKKHGKKYVCDRCLCLFWRHDSLDKHFQYCSEHDAAKTLILVRGISDGLRFKNIHHQLPVPIMFTADFESFTKPIDITHGETKLYQRQEPSAFSLYTISRVEGFTLDIITHICKDENDTVAKSFVKAAQDSVKKIYERFKVPAKMIFDDVAKELHDSQDRCYACSGEFKNDKVCDHCHLTGKYRGALHSKCNLKFRKNIAIPATANRLRFAFVCKRFSQFVRERHAIPHNEQKYMTFQKKFWSTRLKKRTVKLKKYFGN